MKEKKYRGWRRMKERKGVGPCCCVHVRGCNNHSFAKLCGFKVNYLQYLSQGLGDDFFAV